MLRYTTLELRPLIAGMHISVTLYQFLGQLLPMDLIMQYLRQSVTYVASCKPNHFPNGTNTPLSLRE